MGPADLQGQTWVGILLSASLLTSWTLLAAALDANPPDSASKALATPTITVSPSNPTELREQVTCQCFTTEANVTVSWIFNNHLLVPHERMQLSENRRILSILVVQREDTGSYQCEIGDGVQSIQSNVGFLNVSYGPDPIEFHLDSGTLGENVMEVLEGSTLALSAHTKSCPSPLYMWYLPSGHILPSYNHTLHLSNVSLQQGGTYRCLVNNSATQLLRLGALQIRVLERLTKPHVVAPSGNLAENNVFVNLHCQTPHQRAGVHWYIDGSQLLPSERLKLLANNRTLSIQVLLRNDTGPYQCEVWDAGGWEVSDPVSLVINYGPSLVQISSNLEPWAATNSISGPLNSSLILHCRADDTLPAPQYRWTFEGAPWEHLGQQLAIPALTWDHQGIYNCTVNNSLAHRTAQTFVRLWVTEPPEPALSAGAIAGIVIGILGFISLVAGLGIFLHFRKARASRKPPESSVSKDVTSPSVEERPVEPSFNLPRPTYANMTDPPRQTRFRKDPPPDTSEHLYEKDLPSVSRGDQPHTPLRPLPRPVLPAPDPVPPQGNTESDYEMLVNPETDADIYCHISPDSATVSFSALGAESEPGSCA